MKRLKLLLILATMSEESFGYFVKWAITGFPDGLGGFQPYSRDCIKELRKAANEYIG